MSIFHLKKICDNRISFGDIILITENETWKMESSHLLAIWQNSAALLQTWQIGDHHTSKWGSDSVK